MKYLVSFIVILLTISCNSTDKFSDTTYFGGQIINPKTNFVLFLKDNEVLDTINLDDQNKFLQEFNALSEGLYTFKHGSEFQYVFIEPQDSILIRLNTWDFDESLVFSGKGGSKNEYLINLFLQNEKEEKAVFFNQFFDLDETQFSAKLDSISSIRQLGYQSFIDNHSEISPKFQELVQIAIHYPLFRLKEVYPYYYKNILELDSFPVLSDDFFKYRDNINLNNKDFISFYPYQNYVINNMYNKAYVLEEMDSSKTNMTVNVLNSIVENIELEEFKNLLLKRIVVFDFLKSESSCSINENTLSIFLENCSNESFKNEVNNLVNDSKAVENKKLLPNFELENSSNSIQDINSIIKNKNAVIYFWSTEFTTPKKLQNTIKRLEKTLPEVLFIGVNMNDYDNIYTEPSIKKLDIKKQFTIPENSEVHKFIKSQFPRVIIVNRDGIVENGFTFLDSKNIYQELYKLK